MTAKKKTSRARPPRKPATALTRGIQERICAFIRAGSYIETACAAVGIPSRTLRAWLTRGAEASEAGRTNRYTAFADALREAEAAAEVRGIGLISKAAKADWRAAAHFLERRHGRRWGQQVNVKVEAELEKFLGTAERVLEGEAFERLLEALAAEAGPEETE